jgi:hypothetical protein
LSSETLFGLYDDHLSGAEVSWCTGNAHRVRLQSRYLIHRAGSWVFVVAPSDEARAMAEPAIFDMVGADFVLVELAYALDQTTGSAPWSVAGKT